MPLMRPGFVCGHPDLWDVYNRQFVTPRSRIFLDRFLPQVDNRRMRVTPSWRRSLSNDGLNAWFLADWRPAGGRTARKGFGLPADGRGLTSVSAALGHPDAPG